MILEEKIIRIVILSSIFFGLFNFLGQFQGFLTPFIFNYVAVSIVAIIFCIRNRNEKDLGPLIGFTLSFSIIMLFSGQFIYLINLFAHEKVLINLDEWYLILNYVIFWGVIFYNLYRLIRLNQKSKIVYYLFFQTTLLLLFIIFFLTNQIWSTYLFLAFSSLISSNLLIPDFKLTNGIHRMILLIFLNLSLEVLKIASITFI
jgi:hypothetical protein